MMDLRKWVPLWEKCAELRPLQLCTPAPPEGEPWSLAGQWAGDYVDITDETAASLIRDAAMRHLARHSNGVEIGDWGHSANVTVPLARSNGFRDDLKANVPAGDKPGELADLAAALYITCCKDLGIEPDLT